MNKTTDLSPFATQIWLMEPQAAQFLMAQVVSGTLVLAVDETPIVYGYDEWAFFPKAQQAGSTAVISISGTIYPYAAQWYCGQLALIFADENVSSLVIKINSPGGLADSGWKIADMIRNAPARIKTLGWIDYGMASSAGYMIGCSCNQMWASRPNDTVGSIGVFGSWQDWAKYYEKMGVVVKDIYAEQSTEKNLDAKEAQKGNFQPLIDRMTAEATRFIDYVTAQRGDALNFTEENTPFKGKLFSATEGQTIGLIDNIGTLQEAIQAVRAIDTDSQSLNSTQTDMFGFMKATALDAVKGLAASDVTEAHIQAIQEQLKAYGIENVMVVNAAQLEAANAQAAQIVRLEAQVNTLTTTNTDLQAKVTAYGSQSGATPTQVIQTNANAEVTNTDTTPTVQQQLDSLAHNQALDNNPMFAGKPAPLK